MKVVILRIQGGLIPIIYASEVREIKTKAVLTWQCLLKANIVGLANAAALTYCGINYSAFPPSSHRAMVHIL